MWIESFLKYLQLERNYSPGTVKSYRESLFAFEEYFKGKDDELNWDTVDADVIRDWMMHLIDTGEKPTTVNRKLSALRSFYGYLLKSQKVDANPASKVKGPKKSKPLPYFLKESETDHLMDSAIYPAGFEGVRDRLVVALFYETGIRLAELEGLRDCDVDLNQCLLKVTGKRNKQRVIPFGPDLKELIEAYLLERNSRFPGFSKGELLLNEKGQRLSRSSIERMTHHYLSLVTTIKKKSPHVLRHTFATQILNHDGDLEAVKELLGHESVATTEIYTHTTFEELKKIYKQAHPRS